MSIDQSSTAYASLQHLVENEAAIVLHDDKRPMVEMRLSPVAAENGFDNVEALIGAVQDDCTPQLKDSIVEALTTNETSFFREPPLFEALRTEMIPQLQQLRTARQTVRIWSAACSSGQEPYSVAILLLEHFPEWVANGSVEIVASDISHQVLAQAIEGCYRKHEVNRGLQARMLLKYFDQEGDAWRIKPALQRMISWRRINLSDSLPRMGAFDIVLLRNVLIYFSLESKKQVIDRMRSVMSSNGYLCLGGSETLLQIDSSLKREVIGRAAVYRP